MAGQELAQPGKLLRLERPDEARRISWRYATPLFLIHALALLAIVPWFFSWTGLIVFVVGVYAYGGIGINICYHRLLTHRSFTCAAWLEKIFVLVAVCCLEDAPASWVAAHRLHHMDADEKPDPHSPLVSFFWSHMGWLFIENPAVRSLSVYDRYARDILKTPFYMWLQRGIRVLWIYAAHVAAYFLVGFAIGWAVWGREFALQFGASLMVWGALLRTVAVWHITWSVNSLSHLFGYRSYETGENSRNNWFVALLSSGEGWHNNHHEDPASASNWHRWWEIDLMWAVIRSLEIVGLAKNVVRPRRERKGDQTLAVKPAA